VTSTQSWRPEATPALPPVRITDGLLSGIIDRLLAVAPERGGAILAVGDLLYLLVEDTSGQYSRASWDISAQLSATVGEMEAAGHGALAGTVHTHPAGIPDPSGTDVATTRETLDLNPHLGALVIAIVTEGAPRAPDVPVGTRHRMSIHQLRRDARGQASLARVRGETVPLAAGLAAADVSLLSAASVASWRRARRRAGSPHRPGSVGSAALPTVITVDHIPRLAVKVTARRAAALLVHPGYPHIGPIAVTGQPGESGGSRLKPMASPWDPVADPAPQMAALGRTAAGRRVPGSTKRVWPLVGALANRRVLVAGAGSVGSRIAEDLVRSGVGTLTAVDPDRVDAANLARSVYSAADIGMPKPEALGRRLESIDPSVVVDRIPSPLGTLDLAAVLAGMSLVVAATDDMAEQAILAHHAFAAGIPLVACALYRRAAAGEVVLSVPAAGTACWTCAVGAGTAADARRPKRDYGLGGRLAGESALGPSINLVAGVAATVALGLLAGPRTAAGRRLGPLLARRRTLGLITTVPQWDFFGQVFTGMDHQYAPQSVWVRVDRSPDCPVCGSRPVPPLPKGAGDDLAGIVSQYRQNARSSVLLVGQPG
jgi:molybdopterin/thiamine biosynthesis adenylyltransferase